MNMPVQMGPQPHVQPPMPGSAAHVDNIFKAKQLLVPLRESLAVSFSSLGRLESWATSDKLFYTFLSTEYD